MKGSPPGPMIGILIPGGPRGPPAYLGPIGGNPGPPGPTIRGGPGVPGDWFGGEGRRGEFLKINLNYNNIMR